MRFWEYNLFAEALHIGERIKKGTLRPLIPALGLGEKQFRPIPYSTAVGALREYLGLTWETPIHCAGYLIEGIVEELVIAPRDNAAGVSKLPVSIQYLARASGKLFILLGDHTQGMPPQFCMAMGGLRYKGLGRCRLRRANETPLEARKREGVLLTRIPEGALGLFGIDPDRLKADGPFRRGYLFKPTSQFGGVYVRSLFEGSQVEACSFLTEDGRHANRRTADDD